MARTASASVLETSKTVTSLVICNSSAFSSYDVSLDSQRFLMLKPIEQGAPTQINVVLNWFEELKQKVPTGKK